MGAVNPEWHRPSNQLGRRRSPGCAPRSCGNRAERRGAPASAGPCLPLPIGSTGPGQPWWPQKGHPWWLASFLTAPQKVHFLLRTEQRGSAQSGSTGRSRGLAGFGAAGALGWKDTGTELPDFVSDSQHGHHGGCQQGCSRQSCAGWEGWTPGPNRPLPSPAQGWDAKGKGERDMHEMKHSIQTNGSFVLGYGDKSQPWTRHELRLEVFPLWDGLQLLRAGLAFKERHLKGLGSCTSHPAARGLFKEHCPEQVLSSALKTWNGSYSLGVGAQALSPPHISA